MPKPSKSAQFEAAPILDQESAVEILRERARAAVTEATRGDVVGAIIITTVALPEGQHAHVDFRGDPGALLNAMDAMGPQIRETLANLLKPAPPPEPPSAKPTGRRGGNWRMFKR